MQCAYKSTSGPIKYIYRYVVESVYRLFVLDGHLSGRVDRARVIGDNGKQKKSLYCRCFVASYDRIYADLSSLFP